MDTDGSRSINEKQENDHNDHKVGKVLLAPLIWLNKGLTALLKSVLGANYADVTEDEVRDLVDALASDDDEDGIEENSAQMINNIFEFDNRTAADVMTHRTNIVGVDVNSITLDDLIYLALDLGFSRIPAYEESIDRIVGIIIVKDLLCLIGKTDLSDFRIGDFLRDVSYVPESCSCPDVFKTLTEMKSGMAVVVDEYGGTAGIVTLEDLIEAVMGNIQDEYDDEKQLITKIGEDTYDAAGEADPEEVFGLFGIDLPEDHEYETISGFVTDKLGYIPEGTDLVPPTVEYEGVMLAVLQVEDRNILKIRATKLPEPTEDEEDQ